MNIHILKAPVLLVLLTSAVTGFLLDGNQSATLAQCHYGSDYIDCSNKTLKDVPVFDVASYKGIAGGNSHIFLQRNSITSIPRNAFGNISVINASWFTLQFSDNRIVTIDPLAFSGIENRTVALFLTNNSLTTLPTAIAWLNNLLELYVRGNPITTLDPTVLSYVGRSLRIFSIDMGDFKSWPVAMSNLRHLSRLRIYYLPFFDLPQSAFQTFEHLYLLEIWYSNLTRIPTAICHLHSIDSMVLEYAKFKSNSIFTPCSQSLPARGLTLRNLGIHEFPDVLHTFDHLKVLDLANNEIAYVPSDAIPAGIGLPTLILSGNHLTSIPSAISKITNLTMLDMSYNKITTIEDRDLTGLRCLKNLNLDSNPIQYITPHAFDEFNPHNSSLMVSLTNTKLHLIPEAVMSHRILFYFGNINMECSCRMSYLKGWDPEFSLGFSSRCTGRQNETVQHYIRNDLRQCPTI